MSNNDLLLNLFGLERTYNSLNDFPEEKIAYGWSISTLKKYAEEYGYVSVSVESPFGSFNLQYNKNGSGYELSDN